MPNRYVCDVLEEMRKLHKTRNYSPLLGLIEEVQTLVNRMESALGEKSDHREWHERVRKEKKEFRRLLKKTNELREKAGEEKQEMPRYP
jgi:uncharacterized coiled-coil DUF342 family protein